MSHIGDQLTIQALLRIDDSRIEHRRAAQKPLSPPMFGPDRIESNDWAYDEVYRLSMCQAT